MAVPFTFAEGNQADVNAHATRHQNGGADEVSVTGLSGLLADDQHVLDSEVTAVAIAKTTVDAQSLLGGISDDTPIAITVAESRIVGRATGGNVDDLTVASVVGGWNDYVVSGLSLPLAHASAPALTVYRNGLYLPAFTGTGASVKEVFTSIHILHDYKSGTTLYPHIHWSHIIGAPSGNVKWGIEYSVSKGHSQGTFGASTTVYVTQTAAAQYTHQIAEVADGDAIPSTNIEPDSVILLRIFRDPADAADTFENNAFLITIDLHYQSDGVLTVGKVSPFTKTF